ncbi:hypothetical protein EG68_08965 [Paragonimus skrjabini miyazakii]|uniref:Mitochondrial fission regulator 2 n=1 Tax=Paragonimus skrjabini miyazakii TaxID=59628 RepID=A0A8S9YMF4_9TREM|nr:hypothetical protein EG68_08965 [Paragonimus skrjabini miyazakii]
MNSLIAHTIGVLSRLFFTFRSVCSLRRLVFLLPVGKPAPRISLRLPYAENGSCMRQGDSGDISCSTDNTYTSTTTLTDLDDEGDQCRFDLSLSSTPRPRGPNGTWYLRTGRPKLDAFREHSYSDQGTNGQDHKCTKWPSRSRNSSVERAQVPVCSVRGHSNPAISGPSRFPTQLPRRRKIVPDHSRRRRPGQIPLPTHSPCHSADSVPSPGSKHFRGHRFSPACHVSSQQSSSDELHTSNKGLLRPVPQTCDTERINQLETELSRLRAQLARLIVLQEGKQLLIASSEEGDQRLAGDGESDTGPVAPTDTPVCPHQGIVSDQSKMTRCQPNLSAPIPPPPPLMPLPPPLSSPASQQDWRAQLIAKRKQKLGTVSEPGNRTLTPSQPADMNQVLRELQSGSVKLRAIPRSPGGTPIRSNTSPQMSGTDPCAIIARALRNKFSRVRAVLDLSESGGENTLNASQQDSGFQINQSVLEKRSTSATPLSQPRTSYTPPAFGQHLLRSAQ